MTRKKNPLVRLKAAPRKRVRASELAKGLKVEKEHTRSRRAAEIIARQHLAEMPNYYTRLLRMERAGRRRTNPVVTGINIQAPWARLLLSGKKTVETRTYPLPAKHQGVPLAIVETTGGKGPAQVIGLITFTGSVRYATKAQWAADRKRHLVPATDPLYGWSPKKAKYGWIVGQVQALPPQKVTGKGIVYRKVALRNPYGVAPAIPAIVNAPQVVVPLMHPLSNPMVYHATGNKGRYDRFRMDRIKKKGGFGDQVYGWGMYFTKDKISVLEHLAHVGKGRGGSVYTVKVPPHSALLNWDAPLSQQSKKVQKLLAGMPIVQHLAQRFVLGEKTGKWIYTRVGETALGRAARSNEEAYRAASPVFAAAGIPGLRYLDIDDIQCYCIWDERAMTITNHKVHAR